MKKMRHFLLIPVYVFTVFFVLIINGAFSGEAVLSVNLVINVGFLLIMGILLMRSFISFIRLSRCTAELRFQTKQMQKEYEEMGEEEFCLEYLNREDIFGEGELNDAFMKYQLRMKKYHTPKGFREVCDIEEYINEDLIDRIGKNFYNSNMPGTLTGLGILGTFLGLSMGMATFSGENILMMSDSMGALLEGMKVAFHTSVYGIFLSLIFSFIYKASMEEAYTAMEMFQKAFRQFVQPVRLGDGEELSAMIVYQANMSHFMKQILEILKGEDREKIKGVERIAEQFMDHMTESMGEDFRKLGDALRDARDVQSVSVRSNRELIKTVEMLVSANYNMQEKMSSLLETQEKLSMELKTQKEELKTACDEMSDEISSQLYAFHKMRNLYEK